MACHPRYIHTLCAMPLAHICLRRVRIYGPFKNCLAMSAYRPRNVIRSLGVDREPGCTSGRMQPTIPSPSDDEPRAKTQESKARIAQAIAGIDDADARKAAEKQALDEI